MYIPGCVTGKIENIAAYGSNILRNDYDLADNVKYTQL